jgi:tetratricopeptide (TPR) repeat protein
MLESVSFSYLGSQDEKIGWWNFLRQIVVAKELARRLEVYPQVPFGTFTTQVLASLVVADLWIRNVKLTLTDAKIDPDLMSAVGIPDKVKAKELARDAETSTNNDLAVELYTRAIDVDPQNSVYRCGRASAYYAEKRYKVCAEDAYIATLLDPTNIDAWLKLGEAQLALGLHKRAVQSFVQAGELSGAATEPVKCGIENALASIGRSSELLSAETDVSRKLAIHKELLDQDWDTAQKVTKIDSLVHKQRPFSFSLNASNGPTSMRPARRLITCTTLKLTAECRCISSTGSTG